MCELECSQVDALMSRLAAAESEIKRVEALAAAAEAGRAAEMLQQKQVRGSESARRLAQFSAVKIT